MGNKYFMKRRVVLILAVLLIFGTATAVAFRFMRSVDENTGSNSNNQEEITDTDPSRIRLIASGDMLPHDTINERAKTGDGYDYEQFFTEVKPVFDGADIRFCNQEVPSAGEQFGISGYPTFNAPMAFSRNLSEVGCNLINLANNHINDKGQPGINQTLDVWDGLDTLAVAGANRNAEEQSKVRYFEVKGVKFAFAAYAEYSNNRNVSDYGLNLLNESLVRSQLNEAKEQADIVIVSAHWGTEFSTSANDFQRRWAKTFADLGADIVIGHGPHVIQPAEKLPKAGGGETLVWYSIGNMLSTQLEVEALTGGFAVMDIDTETKQLTDVSFLPTYMHYEWTAEEKAGEDLLARKNLKLYPLDKAAEPLSRSLHNTTLEVQTEHIRKLRNQDAEVKIITSTEY
ncbi:hypothetical protein BH23PAT1_BH23PAT1_3820 [soil metagenome]